jgi:hypothetical protein
MTIGYEFAGHSDLEILVQDPVMMKSLLQRTFQRSGDKRDHDLMMAG